MTDIRFNGTRSAEEVLRDYFTKKGDRWKTLSTNSGIAGMFLRDELKRELGITEAASKREIEHLVATGVLVKVGFGSGQSIWLASERQEWQDERDRQQRLYERLAEVVNMSTYRGGGYVTVALSELARVVGVDQP